VGGGLNVGIPTLGIYYCVPAVSLTHSVLFNAYYSLNLILWCILSCIYAFLNKYILTRFAFPVTLTAVQLTIGSMLYLCFNSQNLTLLHRLKTRHIIRLSYTSLFHVIAIVANHASTMTSPSVSHVMIWKSGQPLVSTLLAIALGASSVSLSSASLSHVGILLAASPSTIIGLLWSTLSNLALSARGEATARRLSYRRFGGGQNLFWCLTTTSAVWLLPFAQYAEPDASFQQVWWQLLFSGFLFYQINILAFDNLNQRQTAKTPLTALTSILPKILTSLVVSYQSHSPSIMVCVLTYAGLWRYQCVKAEHRDRAESDESPLQCFKENLKAIQSMQLSNATVSNRRSSRLLIS
jgi:Triose-phosphate Transporter family